MLYNICNTRAHTVTYLKVDAIHLCISMRIHNGLTCAFHNVYHNVRVMLIPGDDISSDLDLSGCNINTDNEVEESYTKVIEMYLEIQLDHNLQHEQREIIDINGI